MQSLRIAKRIIGFFLVCINACYQPADLNPSVDAEIKNDNQPIEHRESKGSCRAKIDTDYTPDADAGIEKDRTETVPMMIECHDRKDCRASERCLYNLCLSDCDDASDLVVPEGENRCSQGTQSYCNVIVSGTLGVESYNGSEGGKLELHAARRIVILPSGSINADGAGYPSDRGPGAGICGGPMARGSGGGSYGGKGGRGCCSFGSSISEPPEGVELPEGIEISAGMGQATAPAYGAASTQTIEMGSGGGTGAGCSDGLGGSGGGAVTLIAKEIVIAGEVSAEGTSGRAPSSTAGAPGSPGAGSGGGFLAIAEKRIELTGNVIVRGGTPPPSDFSGGGGGGGGRVKLFAPEGIVIGKIDVSGGNEGTGNATGDLENFLGEERSRTLEIDSRDDDGFQGQNGSIYISFL